MSRKERFSCRGLQVVESREDTLQTHLHILKSIRSRKVVHFVARTGLAAVFGLFISGVAAGGHVEGTRTAPETRSAPISGITSCPKGDHPYTSTRSNSAAHNEASADHTGSVSCTPDRSTTYRPVVRQRLNALQAPLSFMRAQARTQAMVAAGSGNTFPYGVCTWYADQRYHELHGIYVPWRGNANAWPQGASAYGWRVSSAPSVGSIIALQSGVQGAGGLGHVGIVEQVWGNGTVIATSMNWGVNPAAVTSWQFHPGPGVTFISQ
jgi:surface antigen